MYKLKTTTNYILADRFQALYNPLVAVNGTLMGGRNMIFQALVAYKLQDNKGLIQVQMAGINPHLMKPTTQIPFTETLDGGM